MRGTTILALAAAVVVVGGLTAYRLTDTADGVSDGIARQPAPVEVAAIERGPVQQRRTFTGTLEAHADFSVSAKVGGRIRTLQSDIGDPVRRGQVVVELDDAEYVQAVAQADADLAVTRARLVQARSDLLTATREMERMVTLAARGVASESELDLAGAGQAAEEAQLQVAQAQVIRAEAELETARIRLRYTRVTATWTEGDDDRVVAERHVDVGQTVSPGEPLLRVVELSPLTGVLHVTEKDYSRLARGQAVTLTTDAWPGERFAGAIARIAPVFRESSRQAQVEVEVPNLDQRLKPGMFVRATVVLQRVDDALSVPESALSSRDDRPGLFVVDEATRTVSWRHVTPGIRDRGRVQIVGLELSGRVVTLGQQLLDEGSAITIPADGSAAP